MPAPLAILVAWVGQQLLSEAEAAGWSRIKALIVGDPQVKEIAEALKRSIDETVDIVAKDGSAPGLREGIFNAFTQYQLHGKSAAHGTITQLEFLAPGISLELRSGQGPTPCSGHSHLRDAEAHP
ncbi:hypothetical protein EAS64_42145 [Trebonia kvetii]|uniref:Uncharacterized protein n=1 Tax=Trebonia kvetii TaxID=2480626 RepID=A0A6P2BLX0_9ACTN|nr:hypothetical protein [Trebonia kvetii]TVY99045.1 hypothetical protein EAS64_42145 [Trebonia kvetii]